MPNTPSPMPCPHCGAEPGKPHTCHLRHLTPPNANEHPAVLAVAKLVEERDVAVKAWRTVSAERDALIDEVVALKQRAENQRALAPLCVCSHSTLDHDKFGHGVCQICAGSKPCRRFLLATAEICPQLLQSFVDAAEDKVAGV